MPHEQSLIGVVEDDPVMGGTLVHRLELEGYKARLVAHRAASSQWPAHGTARPRRLRYPTARYLGGAGVL